METDEEGCPLIDVDALAELLFCETVRGFFAAFCGGACRESATAAPAPAGSADAGFCVDDGSDPDKLASFVVVREVADAGCLAKQK